MHILESAIERKACRRAEDELGILSTKFAPMGSTGWPDRIFFIPGGKPLFVEFKRPGGAITPKQRYIHEQLRGLGYDVQTHDNEEQALEAIRAALGANTLHEAKRKISA